MLAPAHLPRPVARLLAAASAALLLLGLVAVRTATASAQQESAQTGSSGDRDRVLFIRGGHLSTPLGPKGDPTDGSASDITETREQVNENDTAGYGLLAIQLVDNGFDVTQLEEDGRDPPNPTVRGDTHRVNLAAADLDRYKVVVFGSNNALDYDDADRDALAEFVDNGGGVLFMSDGNWGWKAGAAPASDNLLLQQFGVEMMQDNGLDEGHRRPDATTPYAEDFPDITNDHPVLSGVDSFGSLGTSTCRITTNRAQILVPAKVATKQNTPDQAEGTMEPPAPFTDAALAVFTSGEGRGICFNDRDQFFNAKLNDNTRSHATLAINMFNWLAGRS